MILLTFGECDPGFLNVWKNKGYNVCKQKEKPGTIEQLTDCIREKISGQEMVRAFTFDYYPVLAEACYRCGVTYISWVWDSPHMTLWSKTVRYDTNRIFLFDRDLYRKLEKRDIEHIYHLPLAVDVSAFQKVIGEDCGRTADKWGSDVTFVGNLYNDRKTAMFDRIEYLPPYLKGYFEALIRSQSKLWGGDMIAKSIPDEVWQEIRKYIQVDLGENYEEGVYELFVTDLLHKKVSQIERKQMCSALARLYSFALYTGSDTSYDSELDNRGYVNYLTEMPLVFHYSKINIQITIRSITSGISQRVLDVLGCEGFLLTNYQPEIAEYFEDGRELVMYHSMEDLCMKISYYLEHEEERMAIATAGYRKVRELFTYENMVNEIMEHLQ